MTNDIALAKIKGKFLYNKYASLACLSEDDANLSNCYIAGWGNQNENSDPADHLQEAKVDIISNCADIAGEDYGDIDEEKQICAGKSEGGIDSCQGKNLDIKSVFNIALYCLKYFVPRSYNKLTIYHLGDSGGPLYCPIDNFQYKLVGIVSFGIGCAEPGNPGVYTRISHYLPFIKSVLEGKQKTELTKTDSCPFKVMIKPEPEKKMF